MLDWNTANFNKAMNKGATDVVKICHWRQEKVCNSYRIYLYCNLCIINIHLFIIFNYNIV